MNLYEMNRSSRKHQGWEVGLREGKMSTQTLYGIREASLQGHSIELQGAWDSDRREGESGHLRKMG